MTLHTYLPPDRLRALAHNETLPDRCTGSALFADISGFTPLTEKLTQQLGARRGIEELTRQINAVYGALIAVVEQHGGSVLSFAGDAITCWFAGEPTRLAAGAGVPSLISSRQSLACALALQTAMQAFPALALKVAVTTGAARRFVIGNPAIQLLDTLAGATIARLAEGEHLAARGEVLIDAATVEALPGILEIAEWRVGDQGARFARIASAKPVETTPALVAAVAPPLAAEVLRPWLLPAVFDREQSGHGAFLTELRPCVALFLRFVGLDYDGDAQAGAKLNAFIAQAQTTITHYEGTLLQLTIGDKGSYLYASFGAPISHEDDARRAVKAALALRAVAQQLGYFAPVQLGLSRGTMRAGAYGGPTRLTYGALGDEVNLAARLMQAAAPGEILVSAQMQKTVTHTFRFGLARQLQLKGKTGLTLVWPVLGETQPLNWHLPEPHYALPMVGRQAELCIIAEKLELAQQHQAQIIGIVGEAGVGKSRLAAEALALARQQGFTVYGGACQSDGLHTPYLVWKAIWGAFFQLDPTATPAAQIQTLTETLQRLAPQRLAALPLIGQLLNLPLPDNDFTRTLEPKYRQSALRVLLEDCLRATLQTQASLIIIEDLHWIDALSHDLLDELARALPTQPLCLIMVYRPPQLARIAAPRLESLPHCTRLELRELEAAEAAQVLRAKLAAFSTTLPAAVEQRLLAQAQGNPFYLEELLNYLHDQGFNQLPTTEQLELPDSLHGLILSRIDRLLEREKITLKVASIIGRLFRVDWLSGYYPALGDMTQIKADLTELARLDITPLDTPEPELAYLFKHIVTHEVTYESLPYATRSQLHEQLAQHLEHTYPTALLMEALAFHYGRSDNTAKKIEYLRRAGEAAQQNYANEPALEYYAALLPLLKDTKEQAAIQLKRGQVLELQGKYVEAETAYHAALAAVRENPAMTVAAQFALGRSSRQRSQYGPALEWLTQAQVTHTQLNDLAGLAQVFIEIGTVYWHKGEYTQAHQQLRQGLALARKADDHWGMALAVSNLGNVAYIQGNYSEAWALYEEGLALRQAIGDKRGISASLNGLGIVAYHQGDYAKAQVLYEESLLLRRTLGDKLGIVGSLNNLGNVMRNLGDYAAARVLHEESLALKREMGDTWGIALSLMSLGIVAYEQGDYFGARVLYEESLALGRELGDKWGIAYSHHGLGLVALVAPQHPTEAHEHLQAGLRLRQELGAKAEITSSLLGVAGLALQTGQAYRAAQLFGAVENALKILNVTLEASMKHFYARTLSATRAALEEAAFQAAWAEGAQWALAEAVQKALSAETA